MTNYKRGTMRIFRLFAFFSSALGLLIWAGCNDNPIDLQKDVYQSSGQLTVDTLYADNDTTYFTDANLSTSFSSNILMGESNGLQTRPIFRFTTLPLNANFQSVKLRIVSNAVFGTGTMPFTTTAYPIKNLWSTNLDSVWNDYQQNVDFSKPLGSAEVSMETGDTLTLDFNSAGLEMFNYWADSTLDVTENFGFLLNFDQSDFIKSFTSQILQETSGRTLFFTYTLQGDTTVYTESTAATFDAFLISGSFKDFIASGAVPSVQSRDYVSSLSVYSTILQFDLRKILDKYPSGIIINSANLQVPVDREHSLINSSTSSNLLGFKLTSEFSDPSVAVDSSGSRLFSIQNWGPDSSYVELDPDNNRIILGQTFLQTELRNKTDFLNLLLNFNSRNQFYSYLSIYKSDQPDITRKPRIIITFWVAPPTRY